MTTRRWIGTASGHEGEGDYADNYEPSGVPVDGDTLVLANSSQSLNAGDLDLSAVTLALLEIHQTFTGEVGNAAEYLKIGATTVRIGRYDGTGNPIGSPRLKLDLGAVQSAITVDNSSLTSTDADLPPIRLLTNHASTVLTVRKGTVGLACQDRTETSTLATVNVGYVNDVSGDASVILGVGVTVTTVYKTGGWLSLGCAATTVTQYAGQVITDGSGAITTCTLYGGFLAANSTGTITTLEIEDGAEADFLRAVTARTVTTCKLHAGGQLDYEPDLVTIGTLSIEDAVRLSAAKVA